MLAVATTTQPSVLEQSSALLALQVASLTSRMHWAKRYLSIALFVLFTAIAGG